MGWGKQAKVTALTMATAVALAAFAYAQHEEEQRQDQPSVSSASCCDMMRSGAMMGRMGMMGPMGMADRPDDKGVRKDAMPGRMPMMGPMGMMGRMGMMGPMGMADRPDDKGVRKDAMPGRMPMMGPMGMMGRMGMMGPMGMMGRMGMMGPMEAMPCRGMAAIPSLLDRNEDIRRGVTLTERGAETWTESDDPRVVRLIQQHAEGMREWLFEREIPFRQWDPLFADLYAHRADITMTVTKTDKGVRATLEGSTPEAVRLVQAAAAQMDRFVVKGWEELHKAHPSPIRPRDAVEE
jgi:hypothetical protein